MKLKSFYFQASTLKVYQKLWKGIVKFNKTDPDVLDVLAATHMDKVARGWYAFMGDGTAMELRMSEQCELITIGERFLPIMYAVGIINNSPFKTSFTNR